MRAALVALLLTLAPAARAEEPAPAAVPEAPAADPVRLGQVFMEANCSGCHAIGPADTGPDPAAPPFRDIVRLYPPEDLAESLGEGIMTGHPDMPEFELTPKQIDGLIAYLDTLLPRP